MAFEFSIPSPTDVTSISIEVGSSVIFVGANGSGKTRLAVTIEGNRDLDSHRISAHRALSLNPSVVKTSEQLSWAALRTGWQNLDARAAHRATNRWQGKAAVSLLNDYDFLLQVLFADQANIALQTHNRARAGDAGPFDITKFEQLNEIWKRVLPHRTLHFTGDDISVSIPGGAAKYSASEMSDGERAIFYLIGQTLAVNANSLLIFDEPELHVHRSIMSKLWDELEAARPDCAFVFITHDLEFAAVRSGAKYVVREYDGRSWVIDPVPEQSGFSDELTTLILGSRRPVLFVESVEGKFDVALYRCCYPKFTVIPRGSCTEVIHSVMTMRRNQDLTRVRCFGVVDADGHVEDEIAQMRLLGVSVLPVSEIENLILLPSVSRTIAVSEGYSGDELESKLSALKSDVLSKVRASGAIEAVVVRYCQRRIDRMAKKIDLRAATTVAELDAEFTRQVAELNIQALAQTMRVELETAAEAEDLGLLLALFDHKGMMADAASRLKQTRKPAFESWLVRVLSNGSLPALTNALRSVLPQIDING
ncbi:AAA family ATPase [Massilia sp. erpn]|uniref:AAA family ATPase n=1 Tax=Massilia sp. erpn TaxID=2738142 RepID=UPI00210434B6|nr:AAA family ATPase [Massilia sp. erpn]UTY56055.1 AAA family ATPase [Massilia sp. erpn]